MYRAIAGCILSISERLLKWTAGGLLRLFFSPITGSILRIHFYFTVFSNLLRKWHWCSLQAPRWCPATMSCRLHKDSLKEWRNMQRRCCYAENCSYLLLPPMCGTERDKQSICQLCPGQWSSYWNNNRGRVYLNTISMTSRCTTTAKGSTGLTVASQVSWFIINSSNALKHP